MGCSATSKTCTDGQHNYYTSHPNGIFEFGRNRPVFEVAEDGELFFFEFCVPCLLRCARRDATMFVDSLERVSPKKSTCTAAHVSSILHAAFDIFAKKWANLYTIFLICLKSLNTHTHTHTHPTYTQHTQHHTPGSATRLLIRQFSNPAFCPGVPSHFALEDLLRSGSRLVVGRVELHLFFFFFLGLLQVNPKAQGCTIIMRIF